MIKTIFSSVLGISAEHDAGIAVLRNGRLVWAANEERYSRVKFQTGWPVLSLAKLNCEFKESNIPWPQEIAIASRFHVDNNLGDWLNLSWNNEILEQLFSKTRLDKHLWGTRLGPMLLEWLGMAQRPLRAMHIAKILSAHNVQVPRIHFIDHHTAHAASAYFSSGWPECLIITQDASGDGWCSKVFQGSSGAISELHAVPFFHSPGHYYEYVTFLFGFKLGREGKVTGLAAQGNPSKTFPIFWNECSYDRIKRGYVNHKLYRKAEMERLRMLLRSFSREDIAAGVQKHLETIICLYVTDMVRTFASTKRVKLAVAGGIFANVRLNQKIAELPCISSLWVYPHMGDGGLAAGAAWTVAARHHPIRPQKIENVYLGDALDVREARAVLAKTKEKLIIQTPRVLARKIARELTKGNVVAVVEGKMEYGPRALGHRTLLSRATDPTVNDWLNKRLKRSEFMPFAPILKAEDVDRYFIGTKKVLSSLPYMTVTVQCNARCKKEAPAIVHVDGTARPQLVNSEQQPLIYEILEEYRKITNLRILINTSYNIHEQPIVRTANDAIQTFIEGNIDGLVLGTQYITLRKNS